MWRVLVLVGVLVAGCGLPHDVDGTLDRVRGGVLRVGVTEHRPWTVLGDEVTGAEAELVQRLADRLGARVRWRRGAESELMAAVARRQLDLVVGGLAEDAPWTEHASLTRPYATSRVVVAAAGEVPADLAGVRVAVRAGTAEVAALTAQDAVPVPVDDVAGAVDLPVAVEHWRAAGLGLRVTDHVLLEREHVWALPLGENGWQVEVERFLLGLPDGEVDRLLAEAGGVAV
ncbi:substrate-binding periplasmic protein [Saccharothrix algeriensis]|uniref:Polar amino acid transport system substrate-binding protein n=1 Tax=Saccharothrix algeriensis TaxID=173560 RepID=A0A8T8HXN0_9PSEU|nr:transporter substrate-binding domain-containing protein [Saccharothrix algeriensis]MBM7815083.1 polar amino acid transport system substrate-binding protein [Saccharothrix algeriensis]QTR03335.1 transporter substrate-binding domain-containing protein [Saccharothrix algeriensis]